MKAWVIAVGSEMLTPFRIDTNSLAITERLNAIGCDVRLKAVVGDDIQELSDVFVRGIGAVDVLICTGGLGPTEDDLTREAFAGALQLPLDLDESIVDRIRERLERRGLAMAAINRRQAMVPRGAVVLANPNGSAPGLWFEGGGTMVALLPGPPREMLPMLEALIAERIAPRSGRAGLSRRVVKIAGRVESDVDATAQPIYSRWIAAPVPIVTTILAVMGQIELHLTASASSRDEGSAALDAAVAELEAALGDAVFSTDGRSLEAVVGGLLRSRGLTLAVAESCSGGLLSSRLTDVPGSSDYFDRGAICYSNDAKVDWLGVPPEMIVAHGAVSEQVARSMATGIRERSATAVGIGITGVAGPGGGTPEKPVGTVAVAVVTPESARVRTFQFLGERDRVKFQAAQAALNMLRLLLVDSDRGRPTLD